MTTPINSGPSSDTSALTSTADSGDGTNTTQGAPAPTVGETIHELHRALRDYIEATYHVSHPALVAERHALLEQAGVISQRPFFESTPRYRKMRHFRDIPGLPQPVLDLFAEISKPPESDEAPKRLIFDQRHEAKLGALRAEMGEQSRMAVVLADRGNV